MLPAGAAAGTPQDDQAEAALARIGVSQDQIKAGRTVRGGPDDSDSQAPTVWPVNVDAVRVFGALRRQWRTAVVGHRLLYLGLDLGPLTEVRRSLRIKPSAMLLDQLHVMDVAGAQALNSQQG